MSEDPVDASKCHRCHQLLSSVCAQQRLMVARPTPEVRIVPPADTSPSRPVGSGQGHTEARNATQGAPPSPEASYRARLGTGSSAHCPLSGKRWDIPEFMPHSRHQPPTRSQGRTPRPPRQSTSSEAQLHGDQPTAQDPGEGLAPKSRAPG